MARGGARPGAGRPARKSANTSPVSARARPRARGGRKSKTVAGRQGRAVGDRSADPTREKCPHTIRRAGRGDRGEHQGVGLDDAGAGWRGRRSDCGPRQGARRPAARHRQDPGNGRRGLDRLGARARAREAAGNQRPWPADKVERWAIDRLIPYAKNARTHSDAQVAAIAASIKEWGWTSPALVGEDGGLIAGTRGYSPLGSSASP